MLHEIRIGDRSRIDGTTTGSRLEQLQERRDKVGHHAIDVESHGHARHNLGKLLRLVNSDCCHSRRQCATKNFLINLSIVAKLGRRAEWKKCLQQVDRDRIVELACNLANIVSITGEEEEVAKYLGSEFEKLGMQVEYQYVEDGRPNVVGTLKGTGGGATLMFNAHMDHFDNPQETVVDDDRIYGRGLVNMKAAFPCYIEAVSALQKAGVKLKGDLIIAGVVGEIEKAQIGRFHGKTYRGAGVGARYLMDHGVMADMCIIGEPTGLQLQIGNCRSALGARQRRRQGDQIRACCLQGGASDSRLGKRISAQNTPQVHAADGADRRHRWR